MENHRYIDQARTLVDSVRDKTLNFESRRVMSIELAALLLNEALDIQTRQDKHHQAELARLMDDPVGKAFTTQVTDQCFRSKDPKRAADQLLYILKKFGIPKFFTFSKRFKLHLFKGFAKALPGLFMPLTQRLIRHETSAVILPGEATPLAKYLDLRKREGVKVNLNHLGEAILGEAEALQRLNLYLADLAKPEIEYISVKISTIYSQLNLVSREHTLQVLAQRLKQLYKAAMAHTPPKFVNLDMEEYRDLHLTIDLFRNVLDNPEFHHFSAGIVLQAYLPDSYAMQQELTQWAMQRCRNGGAPIKIRIVKGANLAMEQVEASLRNWPQAPYTEKIQVDANFKRMVLYGCQPKHAEAVRLGIGSHNLFDIAYAMILRVENKVEPFVGFEMLEGMADPLRRAVQEATGDMLLYCPAATQAEFQFAVAYLVRRLDENTAPENFLRHAFSMTPGTPAWQKQANLFSEACKQIENIGCTPRRYQNRLVKPLPHNFDDPFENEPDTDWSLSQNSQWAQEIHRAWALRSLPSLPIATEPSQVEHAICTANAAHQKWGAETIEKRTSLLSAAAQGLRSKRGELIGIMVAEGKKTFSEADVEISEAIDFAEYYRRNMEELASLQDISWQSKGIVVVAPPWNFPCSIPAGCIFAALATGNPVIFKPAPETILIGWHLANILWEAGIGQDVLQFFPCPDESIGTLLIQDPRVATIMLTGATSTAKEFLQLRPELDLIAETGGKNAIIISNMSDRELAIKDVIQSAFGHAGQKCSACSLAICEAEVYDDPQFLETLKDAAASLIADSQWNLAARVTPLIKPPNPILTRGLTELEEGETWLLEPREDPQIPNLWTPGIKLGVKPSSFTYKNELFGPVLALMRADNLAHAIELANGTPYGLTTGLFSLDEREHEYWIERIEAGNLYINRGITGAIVQRQPFGGCKQSSFGRGAKAGGPNYLIQLMQASQIDLPMERCTPNEAILTLENQLEPPQLTLWKASVSSYAFYWQHYFKKRHDPTCLIGQDNFLFYKPHSQMTLRVASEDDLFDVYRVMAAAITCQLKLQVSGASQKLAHLIPIPGIDIIQENEIQFIQRILQGQVKRLRTLTKPSEEVLKAAAEAACNRHTAPVLANGRIELTHYLREVALSVDYHRYGNLGTREGENRHPLPQSCKTKESKKCHTYCVCG